MLPKTLWSNIDLNLLFAFGQAARKLKLHYYNMIADARQGESEVLASYDEA